LLYAHVLLNPLLCTHALLRPPLYTHVLLNFFLNLCPCTLKEVLIVISMLLYY
jgi:hypothetical protein